MPSFATSTVVHHHTDTVHFELHARNICVVGTPSDVVYAVKDGPHNGLDVILQSDLAISLAGTLNGTRHEGRDMQTSVISQHLLGYFHANSESLGVRPSSEIFLDQEDGAAKLTLSPIRPVLEGRSQHSLLSTINLLYICTTCQTPNMSADACAVANPFSPAAFLPLAAGLDRLTERLVVYLVKQYPLIFGPWRERFDAEVSVFSKLSRAVADIIHRSPHTAFRKKSRRVIKALCASEVTANNASASSLQMLLGDMPAAERLSLTKDIGVGDAHPGVFDPVRYCDTLSRALERLFKTTQKSLRYKGLHSASRGEGSRKTVDCDLVLSECLDGSPVARDIHSDILLGIGLDARVPAELRFDDDAETVGESQKDSDVFYDDNPCLFNIDTRVSDEAEFLPCTPLEDCDDIWGSSQSTTLDDPMLDWTDDPSSGSSGITYAIGLYVPFSDSHPRPDVPTFAWDTAIIDVEDDDGWPDGSAPTRDQAEPNFDNETISASFQRPATFLPSESMSDLAHHLHPLARLSGAGSLTSSHQPSQAQGLRTPFEEALDETTSDFPLLIDDDLEPNAAGGSRSSLLAYTQPTFPPFSAGAEHGVPNSALVI